MAGTVLLCGAWDEGPGYPRTRALRQGLQALGVRVAECRLPALGSHKRELLGRPWRWPGALLGALFARLRLGRALRTALRENQPAAIVVPYPGHFLVRAVAQRSTVPVVLDLFLSAYDTAVQDRGMFAPTSLPARFLRHLDRRACAAADLVLMDTEEHAQHVARLTGLPADRFRWVPVADPEAPLHPAPYVGPTAGGPLRVLFFGTGVPLHGLPVLLQAVAETAAVHLTLVGGTDAERAQAAAGLQGRLSLEPRFVSRERLQELMDRSHLVAGVFGASDKTQRVVPFKVVHALAAGRPVLTADTPAVRRFLQNGHDAFLVPSADVPALAACLHGLCTAPDRLGEVAARARAAYDDHFAVRRVGEQLCQVLAELGAEVRT